MKQQTINGIDNPLMLFADRINSIPLKIGAPSFVYPAGYSKNVELLRDVFDEIQLLILEPLENSPLEENELAELERLKDDRLSYSLHLPIPGNVANKNENGMNSIIKIINTFAPLSVENFVLHVENRPEDFKNGLTEQRINRVLDKTGLEPERICVENLHESFDQVWDSVESTSVSICFDVGHLLYTGGDPLEFIDRYGDRIRMAHIHGVSGKDHRPLNAMRDGMLENVLQKFIDIKLPGAVIIENYSVDEMVQSLRCLCDSASELRKS